MAVEAAWLVVPTREQTKGNGGALKTGSGIPASATTPPVGMGFPYAVNSLWKYPHRHTQRCASLAVLLDSIKLTMGINHHNVKNQFGSLLSI